MSDLAQGITRRLVCLERVNGWSMLDRSVWFPIQVERYTPVLGGSWKIEKARAPWELISSISMASARQSVLVFRWTVEW